MIVTGHDPAPTVVPIVQLHDTTPAVSVCFGSSPGAVLAPLLNITVIVQRRLGPARAVTEAVEPGATDPGSLVMTTLEAGSAVGCDVAAGTVVGTAAVGTEIAVGITSGIAVAVGMTAVGRAVGGADEAGETGAGARR
jgi:hypothetical protein